MKKLFLLSCLFAFSISLFAQNFEGKIVFNMSFPDFKDPELAAMLPKEAVTFFKNNQSRMEMNMMMGMRNSTISNGETNSSITLMDLMGQKYAIENSNSTALDQKKITESAKVTLTKDKKMIAGYSCTKALVEMLNPEKPSEKVKMDMWFTKEISINKSYMIGPMEKIDGSVLEFSLYQSGMMIVLSAKEVLKQPVSDDLFSIPNDYKRITAEDLKKMMGGK
jgi:GLPGLI family protein